MIDAAVFRSQSRKTSGSPRKRTDETQTVFREMTESLQRAIDLQGTLGSVVRFSTDFESVRNEPFMEPFQDQY